MYNMIGMLGSGILGTLGSVINTSQVNKTNLEIADKTNRANRDLVEMQNKAAKQESELAYQRSKPTTQVGNLMQAGMSRAGAINTLNGGGSYTPAPVNASQDSAPTMQTTDFSALSNIVQAFAQRSQQKHDEKMQAKQLAAAKEQQKAQLDLEREKLDLERNKFDETAGQNAALRNLWQQESELKKVENKLANLRYDIESATKDNRISAENKENIARVSRAILDDLNSQMQMVGYENMNPEVIKTLMELRAQLEIVGNVGEMSAAKVIELFHNIKNLIANWL